MSIPVYISSGNKAKSAELVRVLAKMFPDISGKIIVRAAKAADETGNSYKENALIKAMALHQELVSEGSTSHIVIADDSGMEVASLNREPGLYSARYAEQDCLDANKPFTFQANIEKVLNSISKLPKIGNKHSAEMVCHLTCIHYFNQAETIFHSEGRVTGQIRESLGGMQGFGYDPIFFYEPKSKSFAQIPDHEKDEISHRFQACQELKNQISKTKCFFER